MSTVHEADIAHDPVPHNGGVSTREAMPMGVPALTLPGLTLVHRASSAILSAAGMPE